MILADDGSPATMFTAVLVSRLPDGALLVADRGSKELRVFRDGSLVTQLSRQGDGPGELQDISKVSVSGDTIVVMPMPMVSREVSTFTASAGFLHRRRLHPDIGGLSVTPVALLSGGAFLVTEGLGVRRFSHTPDLGVPIQDSVTLGLLLPAEPDSAMEYRPLLRVVRSVLVAHRPTGEALPFAIARIPLAHTSIWTASSDLVWIVASGTGHLQAFDGSGERVVDAYLPVRARAMDARSIRRSRDRMLAEARSGVDSAAALATHALRALPPTLPILDGVFPAPGGTVWVRLYQPDPVPSREYLVVDRTGEAVARVLVPADLDIHQIGVDFVLGVRRDADGVQTVVEYGLSRGASPH